MRQPLTSVFYFYMTQLLISQQVILEETHIHKLHKRGLITEIDKLQIINVTFPCNSSTPPGQNLDIDVDIPHPDDGTTETVTVSVTIIDRLEEEDMKSFFKFKGGTYMREYIASNSQEAEKNFPDAMWFRRGGRGLNKGFYSGSVGRMAEQKRLLRRNRDRHTSGKTPIGRKRKRRQTTASDPTNYLDQKCTPAGTPSEEDANYLHLCTMCSVNRILPLDRYPKIINEVKCQSSDAGCLGAGNGKCVRTLFNVHLLRRKDGVCRICIKDDQTLAMGEWELYLEPIGVGCECMVEKTSHYSSRFFSDFDPAKDQVG